MSQLVILTQLICLVISFMCLWLAMIPFRMWKRSHFKVKSCWIFFEGLSLECSVLQLNNTQIRCVEDATKMLHQNDSIKLLLARPVHEVRFILLLLN